MHHAPTDAIHVIDSHTEGESTRVVVGGWPRPEGDTMVERREFMRRYHDQLRRALVVEPRGYPAMVGALLTAPVSADADAGVIFFNNSGYLGMCGHGLMGVARTLSHMGRVAGDSVTVDTPAGCVHARLLANGSVEIENVASWVHRSGVTVEVDRVGSVTGDIAYGGNWFFITEIPGMKLELGEAAALLEATGRIELELRSHGIGGSDGAMIDHIELSGPPVRDDADSRNFVRCPGGEYDRSPCGTGTSAKLAVLHSRGLLESGQEYRQESITGSLFTAKLVPRDGNLVPLVSGRAFITAESTLLFDSSDPFRYGLPDQ